MPVFLAGLVVSLLVWGPLAQGVELITDSDFVPTIKNEVGSGNGTLDLLLLTESAGGSENADQQSGFDADDANTDMPTGTNNTSATESYVTSIDEIRDFYILNFPDGQGGSEVVEIVVFLDINQTGSNPVSPITLNRFDIVMDYNQSFGDDRDTPENPTDVSSALQNLTNGVYGGGTLLATLDASPKVLPLNEQGAGFADYWIFTGIDPFDASLDGARLLFDWSSEGHNDGGETVFLSGEYGAIPEPGSMALLGFGLVTLLGLRRRKQ